MRRGTGSVVLVTGFGWILRIKNGLETCYWLTFVTDSITRSRLKLPGF